MPTILLSFSINSNFIYAALISLVCLIPTVSRTSFHASISAAWYFDHSYNQWQIDCIGMNHVQPSLLHPLLLPDLFVIKIGAFVSHRHK